MNSDWIDALARAAVTNAGVAAERGPGPGEGSECAISLSTSSRDGIVALVEGNGWRWAHSALDTAGFTKNADGHRCLPLNGEDLDHTRDALHTLGVLTQRAGVRVTASTTVYIGDFARDLSEHLPGHWDVTVESYALTTWQGDLASWMWSPSLKEALNQRRVPRAAMLKHSDGTELAIIEDPRADRFHVGALHPKDLFADGLVTPPAGVTISSTPAVAAADITSRLLPTYTRAVLHRQVNAVENDLDWIRRAHPDADARGPLPVAIVEAFVRFSESGPQICGSVRRVGVLAQDDLTVLQQINDVVADPAVGPRPELVNWWLRGAGDRLVALARRAVPDAEPTAEPSRPALGPAAVLPPTLGPGSSNAHR
ncbi:hypothetical protein [Streptomyces microflavus]